MRTIIALLAVAAVLPSVAQAGERASNAASQAAVHKVYVCEMPDKGRQAWSREHGWLRFSSAEDLMRTAPRAGAAPTCITERQLKQLQREAPVVAMTLASR
jgi:hypothetical protein